MKLVLTDKNQLICAGLYSNDLKAPVEGSFYNRINLTSGDVEISKSDKFSMKLITENLTEKATNRTQKRAGKGKDVGLSAYSIDDLYFKSDGTVALVAEQHYVTSSTMTTSDGRTYTVFSFSYNDILVINFEQETGEILWSSKIDKKQRTSNDFGLHSSYALSVVNNRMFFVFNDNLKNFGPKAKKNRVPFDRGKHSIATVVEMEANGDYKQKTLFVAKAKNMLCRPVVSEQISPNDLIIYGTDKKKSRFIKLQFDSNKAF
jgi:hypothetical protein